jgi:transcriptional regulator with XRE-family HTH domain|tara:strand:+ start:1487 stop:1834 length:348 start_codon:yes stop_codon:yes gene_type:complete
MIIEPNTPVENILIEWGHRLAARRLAKNLTQKILAREAGIGLRTLQRLESGAVASQLSSLVAVCKALGLDGELAAFIPERAINPMDQLRLAGKERQRASNVAQDSAPDEPWAWGE